MPEENRFGMRVIRQGGKYSVYTRARQYVKSHLSEFDVIVDEINTVPFRIPKVAKGKPVLALIHQLAREIWFYETRFPMSLLGYFALEPLWLRGYKRIPTVTVSDSTKNDLFELGFEQVHLVSNGITTIPVQNPPRKESNPVLIFVGRLVNCKLPQHALAAFKKIRMTLPESELWVLGDGYLRNRLEREKVRGVRFFGRVNDDKKYELLRRAHVLLAPSVREGWGISVIEANASGTPAVGYAVPGLRDSIRDGKTGYLVTPFDVDGMAKAALSILCDENLRKSFSQNGLEWSRTFSWDASAKSFFSILNDCVVSGPSSVS